MELFKNKIHYYGDGTILGDNCGDMRLNGSFFARNQYCANNFNNIISSLVVLFDLMVVNQWHSILYYKLNLLVSIIETYLIVSLINIFRMLIIFNLVKLAKHP